MSDLIPELEQWKSLTKREKEVSLLIAQFHTNKEIAEILNITEKTVEHHVSHILNKLSLCSRREIGRWVTKLKPRD